MVHAGALEEETMETERHHIVLEIFSDYV